MSMRRLFALLLTTALWLGACATPTANVPPTVTPVPTTAASATQAAATPAPAATAAATGTAAPAVIATAAAHDLVPKNQINPQTEARLRLGYYVADGPNVDLILNNAIAVNGDQPQVNIPANYDAGYLYLMPGSYNLAVVPNGRGLAQALAGPLDVPLVAGHRYTLAIMGQLSDKSVKPLLVDETAEELKAGATPTDSVRIWVNNLAGGTAIDVSGGGGSAHTQVAYGASSATVYPAGNFPFVVKLAGPDSAYPGYDDPSNAPGTTDVVAFVGTWGSNSDTLSASPSSELGLLDYLQGFSGKNISVEGPTSFDTLLAAIKTAGLTDLLTTGGPYYFLAPTDAAFKNLPDQQRTALLANPQALGDLLRYLLVPAYVPRGSLALTPGGVFSRTLTNLLGSTLTVSDGFLVNGVSVGGNSVFLADGTQLHPISQLLLPPSVVALAPATPTAMVATTVTISATGRIAYYAGADHSPDSQLEIYLINPDGSGKIQVTNNQFSDDLPVLSPDGKRIAFVSDRDGSDEIYVMPTPATQAEAAAADKSAVRLTKNGANDKDVQWALSPQWSPDGKQIAFVSNHQGNAEIYVINADGTGQKRLTNNPATDTSPNWSPDGKHIAFDSDRGGNVDVYTMNVDGSGVKDLTNNMAYDGQPVWSPDGQQIAFVSDRGRTGTGTQIFVMQADGSGQTNLSNSSGNDFAVIWSPDGADLAFFRDNSGLYLMRADGSDQTLLSIEGLATIPTSWSQAVAGGPTGAVGLNGRIAYESSVGGNQDANHEIFVMNADGSGQTQLTKNSFYDGEPAMSPDGKRIAFDTHRDGNNEIYVMNADGSGQTNLTNNTANDEIPSWSPDGKQIAFFSHRDGNDEIYVMNADGSGVTRLTNNPGSDTTPGWSPDGKQLSFCSDRDGSYQIYSMNADGSHPTNLTWSSANDCGNAWSADGKKIVFQSDRDGNDEIYSMNVDGSDVTRLSNNPAHDGGPTLSPDGQHIVFDSDRSGSDELFVMNADGSGQTRLTKDGGWWPSWSR